VAATLWKVAAGKIGSGGMGIHVVVVYMPKAGGETKLEAEVARHVPTLRRLGMATGSPSLALRASDGAVIEHFEWTDRDAMTGAHQHPEVQQMWARFEECCSYGSLSDLPNSGDLFAEFELLGIY
jgi:hypothetical protein